MKKNIFLYFFIGIFLFLMSYLMFSGCIIVYAESSYTFSPIGSVRFDISGYSDSPVISTSEPTLIRPSGVPVNYIPFGFSSDLINSSGQFSNTQYTTTYWCSPSVSYFSSSQIISSGIAPRSYYLTPDFESTIYSCVYEWHYTSSTDSWTSSYWGVYSTFNNLRQFTYYTLPIYNQDGSHAFEPEYNYFSMSSVIDSTGTGYFKVFYTGTDSEYHQCNFYACTYTDWLSWQSSNTSNTLDSVSVYLNNIVRQTDSSEDYDSFFEHLPPYMFKDVLDIFDSKDRISPIYHAPKSKQLSGQPSPSIVVGYDKASQIVPAYATLDFTAWRDNASLGGVYGSTDIVVFVKCMREVPDLIHGGTKVETYFCFQRFDISSILNQLYVPPALITEPEDIHPPTEGSINDLENLAQYMSYIYRTTNNNNTTIYNNYMSNLSQDAPLYVYGGLQMFLPELSAEFDTILDGFSVDISIPSPADISSLQNEINLSQAAFVEKFAWTAVITSEVDFVTSTVVAAGDTPPVISVDASYYSPSSSRNVDYGQIVLFDGTRISSDIVDKSKDIITVFCSLGLLFFIYKTLPATIGRIPEK